jgi:hypothetical protein
MDAQSVVSCQQPNANETRHQNCFILHPNKSVPAFGYSLQAVQLSAEDRCAVKTSAREDEVTKLIAVDAEAMNSPIRASALALEDGKHTTDRLTKPSHRRLGCGLIVGNGRGFISPVEIAP